MPVPATKKIYVTPCSKVLIMWAKHHEEHAAGVHSGQFWKFQSQDRRIISHIAMPYIALSLLSIDPDMS